MDTTSAGGARLFHLFDLKNHLRVFESNNLHPKNELDPHFF
jgi:hypothetical protein